MENKVSVSEWSFFDEIDEECCPASPLHSCTLWSHNCWICHRQKCFCLVQPVQPPTKLSKDVLRRAFKAKHRLMKHFLTGWTTEVLRCQNQMGPTFCIKVAWAWQLYPLPRPLIKSQQCQTHSKPTSGLLLWKRANHEWAARVKCSSLDRQDSNWWL